MPRQQDPLLMTLDDRLAVLTPGRFRLSDDPEPTPLGLRIAGTDTLSGHPIEVQVWDPAKIMLQPAQVQHDLTARIAGTARFSDRLGRGDTHWMPPVLLSDPSGTPPFLVQELLDGMSLAEVMRRRGSGDPPRLPIGAVRPLAEATLQLLAGVHGLGLTLPGMRPESLITTDAQPRVRILTPLPESLEEDPTRWLPPEILEGDVWTTASDVYLAGAVLYWALMGVAPYEAELITEGYLPESDDFVSLRRQRRIYTALPLAPSARLHGIPAEFERLLLDLLQRDPALRPDAATAITRLTARVQPLAGLLSRFSNKTPASTAAAIPVMAVRVGPTSIDMTEEVETAAASVAPVPVTTSIDFDAPGEVAPRTFETLRRPALIGAGVAVLALGLWAAVRPKTVDEHASDRASALLSDLPRDLVQRQLEKAPPSQPLKKPERAASKNAEPPKTPEEPQGPAPATEPPVMPEEPTASAATPVLPPEVETPTPVPEVDAPPADPIPAPDPKPEVRVPEPEPAKPEPTPDPIPARQDAPTEQDKQRKSLFELEATIPSTAAPDPTPALDAPTPGPRPAPQPQPGPALRVVPGGPPQWGFSAHERQVWSVDISPDGRTLASGGRDEYPALWDLGSGSKRGQLTAPGDDHLSWITTVSYSHDGRFLATGSEDATVKVWEVGSKKLVNTFRTPGNSIVVRSLDFDPASSRLYVGYGDGRGTIRILDTRTWKEIPTSLHHSGSLQVLQVSPDGKRLATGGRDNVGHLWNLTNQSEVATLSGHRGWVQALAFGPRGQLATGSSDGSVRLWSGDGTLQRTFAGIHQGGVYSVSLRPSDGRLLATGGADNTIRLWNASDGTSLGQFGNQGGIVTSLVISPDGRRLVASTLQDPFGKESRPDILVYRLD